MPDIGKLIYVPEQRDAIHVAVIPAIADESLTPGVWVRCKNGHATLVEIDHYGDTFEAHGIVDPFLANSVKPGETFWLFLKPNSITGMRHHWEHTDFTDASPLPYLEKTTVAGSRR